MPIENKSRNEVAKILQESQLFVNLVYQEGFGLPSAEAMACGCPVIASNCASLPEVAGGAALLFSPEDHIELAQALHQVTTKPDLRYRLVTKGLIRAKYFSWETTTKETLKVYYKVIDELHTKGYALGNIEELAP